MSRSLSHVGLPGQNSVPEDHDNIMDDQDFDNRQLLRDCLRSELKAFAEKYHFDELRNEMVQACEKLRCDLLKDRMALAARKPGPAGEVIEAPKKRASLASQESLFGSLGPLPENEIKAPREVRISRRSFRGRPTKDAGKVRKQQTLTWSSWVTEGDSPNGLRRSNTSPALRQAGQTTIQEGAAESENGKADSTPYDSVDAPMAPAGSIKKVPMFEETPSRAGPGVGRRTRTMGTKQRSGASLAADAKPSAQTTTSKKSQRKAGLSFHKYVTQRCTNEDLDKSDIDDGAVDAFSPTGVKESLEDFREMDKEPTWRDNFVNYAKTVEGFMDYPIAVAICLNGIFLGIQAQYQSVRQSEELPIFFPIFEIVFFFIFLTEIIVRLIVYGKRFLKLPGLWWNCFDTLLVGMQFTEVIGMFTTSHEFGEAPSSTNFSFLRLVRVLRLFRVLRLVRLLQFITELNVIISSIANSVRSLFWTMFLLMLMIYMVGITFTQVVFSHRMQVKNDESAPPDEVEDELEYWWGTLLRSTLSLFQAILGGVDWDSLVDPLSKRISVMLAPVFVLYIGFSLLAMMNVITGIFVESALKNAAKDKDNDFVRTTTELFADGTVDTFGIVRQEDFESKMACEDLQAFVRQVGIEPRDAIMMFRLIDGDCSGSLYLDQLLSGMLRLRSGVKLLDLAVMMHDQQSKITDLEEFCVNRFEEMEKIMMDLLDDHHVRVGESVAHLVGGKPTLARAPPLKPRPPQRYLDDAAAADDDDDDRRRSSMSLLDSLS